MDTEVAISWGNLNELLFSDTWNPNIQRHRSTYAYRGISDASYELANGLSRLGKPYSKIEENLLKQFQKYAHLHIAERDTEWHWLSIAQHHGLPTRLLDWTYSPPIALHFATNELEKYDTDGCIWKVNYSEVHDLLPRQQATILEELGAKIFSIDALVESISDLKSLSELGKPDNEVAVFFEPPAIDKRIINQFAYFSAMSDPFMKMDEWLETKYVSKRVTAKKIIIPKELKWEVRDKLDQSNINERVLMPDLDGLSAWLKRHYTPREIE